jgi:DNA-binding transcriptional ArsR family regulator
MGITKSDRFSKEQNALAELAKVLGHPARIAILQYLATRDSCVCGSIVNEIGLAQATVSQHLKALKEAGFIQGSVDGVSMCYCINTKHLVKVNRLISSLLNTCCEPSNCC